MKRKIREIALLMLPVIAIAAIVPGVRWFNAWNKARFEPHIEACYLRAPTAWEAYHGADVAYTARTRFVLDGKYGQGWFTTMELTNEDGRSWADEKPPGLHKIELGHSGKTFGKGSERTTERRAGLRWDTIVGQGESVRAKVGFGLERVADNKKQRDERTFVWKNPVSAASLDSLRAPNFILKKVELSDKGDKSIDMKRFRLTVQMTRPLSEEPYVGQENWSVRFKAPASDKDEEEYAVIKPDIDRENGFVVVKGECFNAVSHRGTPGCLGGLLGIDDGWPQQIRIELPQGLPAGEIEMELPFTTKLAPLPK